MARPRVYSILSVSKTIGLSPETSQFIGFVATRRGVSVRYFLGSLIETVVSEQKRLTADPAWYRATQRHSTLGRLIAMAAETSSNGMCSRSSRASDVVGLEPSSQAVVVAP